MEKLFQHRLPVTFLAMELYELPKGIHHKISPHRRYVYKVGVMLLALKEKHDLVKT